MLAVAKEKNVTVECPRWSGRNSVVERERAASHVFELAIEKGAKKAGHAVVLIGHSQGGNIAHDAAARLRRLGASCAVICVSTPFLIVQRRCTLEPILMLASALWMPCLWWMPLVPGYEHPGPWWSAANILFHDAQPMFASRTAMLVCGLVSLVCLYSIEYISRTRAPRIAARLTSKYSNITKGGNRHDLVVYCVADEVHTGLRIVSFSHQLISRLASWLSRMLLSITGRRERQRRFPPIYLFASISLFMLLEFLSLGTSVVWDVTFALFAAVSIFAWIFVLMSTTVLIAFGAPVSDLMAAPALSFTVEALPMGNANTFSWTATSRLDAEVGTEWKLGYDEPWRHSVVTAPQQTVNSVLYGIRDYRDDRKPSP